MKRNALRTYIGLSLEFGFGLLPLALSLQPYVGNGPRPGGPGETEWFVLWASCGIANFVLAAVGLALFWAVRDLRLHWAWAALLFLAAAMVSLFVPNLLMHVSQLFWSIFTGDSAFTFLIAPLLMAMFAGPAVLVFAISLVFARWHSHVAPSEPSASSRGSPDWLVRGSLLGGAAVIVGALLVLAFWEIGHRLTHPDDPGGHFKLGVTAYEQGRIDEAIVQYRKALEARPNNDEAYYRCGLALADKGQFDEAIAHYQMALEIKPDAPQTHYRLGIALARRGRADEALAHFQRALEIKPDDAEAHYQIGLVLADRGRLAEAIAHYQKALELEPNYKEVRQHLRDAIEMKQKHR